MLHTHRHCPVPLHPKCPPVTWIWDDSCGASVSEHVADVAQTGAESVWRRYEIDEGTGKPAVIGDRVRTGAPSSLWPTRRRRPARLRSPAELCTHMTADWASVWPTTQIDPEAVSSARTTPSRRNGRCRTTGLRRTIWN